MAGRMYLGNQMVTPAIVSGGVDSVNGQTGEVVLTASDVNALPDTTKYAKTLGLSMNQTTFVLSWQLYDQNGDPIGQVQTVDLPLESVVVSGSYDSVNKKIVLTLENGTTVDVPVGDLVAGLQSEITITNMLSSDLVDDTNKTHKFVTTEEKTTWNNKQNAISDLATIRAGASAGATAVQPSAIANMQTTTNLVTEVDDDSTDTQYPSAKCVYDISEDLLDSIYSMDDKIDATKEDLESQIDAEASQRSAADNTLLGKINTETERAEGVENTINNTSMKTTDTMPIVDYILLNVPVQYKGTTTQDYVYGYFYKFTNPLYSSTVTITTGSFTVSVNNSTFISKFGKAGSYRFVRKSVNDEMWWYVFLNGSWYMDIPYWQINQYGITITGTVEINDEFTVEFTMSTTSTQIDVQPSNAGTVTSVNNVQPVNGNVTLTASNVGALPDSTVIPTDTSDLTNGAGYITSSALSGYATQTWVGQQGYLTSTALSGYATEQWVGQQGYITGITSSDITTALGYTPYNGSVMTGADGINAGTSGLVPAPAATDNTKYLRGDGTWQTVSSGGSYSAGTGIDITNNTISVTSPTLTNTATGSNALTILGTAATSSSAINIGRNSSVSGTLAIAIGDYASASSTSVAIGDSSSSSSYGVAIGHNARATANYGIQLGQGANSEANSFYVGTSSSNNWKLLGSDGKIPDGRLPIATSVSSSSTNADVVGAKLFYDTCGDIETLINAL